MQCHFLNELCQSISHTHTNTRTTHPHSELSLENLQDKERTKRTCMVNSKKSNENEIYEL